ncbi:MAG: dephospho-CoA kinase [Clostridiales bacterium]|jgi:cytidylate kinase|nr:dephospho-CoA kinase [Clostridiales bacterium]
MHITITGNLGSGKSTISKYIRDNYGFEIYSTGTIQRKLAKELGKTTLEMNELMCSDPKYDNMIDDATTRTARENLDKDIIFDSRLAWNFVEKSFKVFVSVSLNAAADRVFKDTNRGSVEEYSSVLEAKDKLRARAETENIRFKEMYDLEYFNFKNYNLVIDSTYNKPEDIANVIIEEAKKFYKMVEEVGFEETNKGWNCVLVSTKRLLHTDIEEEERVRLRDLVEEIKETGKAPAKKILVKSIDDEYHIIEGKDEVIASHLAGLPFVEIILTA